MAIKYRVKPIFDYSSIYSKYYVIQEKGRWCWHTISQETMDKEKVMKDCQEAQELYDKFKDDSI
jgi:hypothetical protein